MSFSLNCLNCLLLGETSFQKIFQITLGDTIIIDNTRVLINEAGVGQLKRYILSTNENKFSIKDSDLMKLWKVEIKDESMVKDVFTEDDIKNKLGGTFMKTMDKFIDEYFSSKPPENHVHIIIAVSASTGKCLPMFYLSNKKFGDID